MNQVTFLNRNYLIGFGAIIASLAFLYSSVLKFLVDDWIHLPDFSHGFLIPFVSIYFVYESRKKWSSLSLGGQWSGLVWIVLAVFLLFLGNLATEYFIQRVSLLVVMGGMETGLYPGFNSTLRS